MRTLRRPMFRGGSTGTGITSGLAPRQGYKHGGTHPTTEERLREAAGQQRDTSLNDFLINFGLNIASATPSGNIFQTAAASAKEPYQGYMASKAARAGFERDIGLEAAKIDIGHEQATEIQELQNQGKIDVALIANDPSRTATGMKLKELKNLLSTGSIGQGEYDQRLKDILTNTSLGHDITVLAAAIAKGGMVTGDEAITQAIAAIEIIQEEVYKVPRKSEATGGRVGYQMGNAVTGAMPMQASAPQAMAPEGQPSVQMPYQEFRAAIPAEVSDEIVQLIYYNQDAFADFAQITTQADVYAFNNKSGVSLVLPMDTKTT